MDTSNFKEVFESPKVKTLTAQVAALELEVVRLRGQILLMIDSWWPFVHGSFPSDTARDMFRKASDSIQPPYDTTALNEAEHLLDEAHNALLWYYEMHADSDISQLLEKLDKHLNPL